MGCSLPLHSCGFKHSPHLEVLWSGVYPVETLENVKPPRGFKLAAVISLPAASASDWGTKQVVGSTVLFCFESSSFSSYFFFFFFRVLSRGMYEIFVVGRK